MSLKIIYIFHIKKKCKIKLSENQYLYGNTHTYTQSHRHHEESISEGVKEVSSLGQSVHSCLLHYVTGELCCTSRSMTYLLYNVT